jgi:hypothetical protein
MLLEDGTGAPAAPAAPPTPMADGGGPSDFVFDMVEEDEQTSGDQPPASPETVPPVPGAKPPEGEPAKPASPAPSQEGAPPQAAAGSPAPGAGSPAQPSPFSYRSSGEDYVVEGSQVLPDGRILFPAEAAAELGQLLSEGQYFRGSWREQQQQMEQRVAQAEHAADAREAQLVQRERLANAMMEGLANLRKQGPEGVAKWLDDMENNWEKLELKAKLQLAEQARQQYEGQVSEHQVEQEAVAMVPQLEGALEQQLGAFAADPEYAGVDRELVLERVLGRLDEIFFEADERIARQYGVPVGTPMRNFEPVRQEFEYQARILHAAGDAARRNAAAAAPSAAPPTVGGPGALPAPDQQPGKPRFKSREEMDHYFESGAVFDDLHR